LQPRSKIETVLGKPVKSSECIDTTGWQYEYGDGSYLCVDHGRVISLSYRLRRTPSNFNDALSAVGLHTAVQPVQPFAPYGIYLWSAEKGNPLIHRCEVCVSSDSTYRVSKPRCCGYDRMKGWQERHLYIHADSYSNLFIHS
jgi:hypothetical protein